MTQIWLASGARPWGRRRVRTKQGAVCVRSLGFQASTSPPMFRSLLPAPMMEGAPYHTRNVGTFLSRKSNS